MIYLGLFLLFLFSFVRGIAEGQVFYLVNPRQHPWFRLYHPLRILEALALITAAIMIWTARSSLLNFWLVSGALFMLWEITEVGYKWARLGHSDESENVMGFYEVRGRVQVFFLHAGRLILGIGLLLTYFIL